MRTHFRTVLSGADIVWLIIGLLLLGFSVPGLPGAVVGALVFAFLIDNPVQILCLVVLVALLAVAAWLGWTMLPPFRTSEVRMDHGGLTLRHRGRFFALSWQQVALLRIDKMPVAHRIFGNGPKETWHLVAVPVTGSPEAPVPVASDPIAVPLDTFQTTVDEVVAAFQDTAPESVRLELSPELDHLGDATEDDTTVDDTTDHDTHGDEAGLSETRGSRGSG